MPDLTMTQLFLTFFFVFAVVYGVTIKSKVFEKQKGVNITIALVMALFSIMYDPLALWLISVLPIAVILLLVVFGMLLLKSLFTKDQEDLAPMIAVLAVLLLVLAYTQQFLTAELSQEVIFGLGVAIVGVMFYLGSKAQPPPP